MADERLGHRIIRSFQNVAWKTHDCIHCAHLIEPGDMYCAWVVVDKKHIWTERAHTECPDDPRWWEEKDRLEEIPIYNNQPETVPTSLPLAA